MFLIIYYSFKTGVVPMPSSFNERLVISEIIQRYENHSNITELGAGWGGNINMLSKLYPNFNYTAVELSIVPYLIGKALTYYKYQSNINWNRDNFLNTPLENSTIYITYLSGPVMKKLRGRFEKDHPKGVVLISIAFAMPGWTPTTVKYAKSRTFAPIYIYELE